MDVHVIGVGKDQYNEYLDQMVEGRILPWTEDSQSEGYPVWTEWEAGQRDVFFLNRNGIIDTTFNITPYDPGNPDDYVYIMNLILELRNETGGLDCLEGEIELWGDCNDYCSDYCDACMSSGCWSIENATYLEFQNSGLTGEIPESIGSLINLTMFQVSDNQLTGAIPETIGNLTNLIHLYLNGNQLTGEIPETIGNLTNIRTLKLEENEFSGEIPESIGNLTELQELNLSHNGYTGEIPNWIVNISSLSRLRLHGNQFSGEIPETIGNLTNLIYLNLSDNQLTGEIPESICSLVDNCNIQIYNNQLCPPYPACIVDYVGEQDTTNCSQGSVTVDYLSGWNMVGLPVLVEDASYGTLFSDAVDGTLYGYEGTYYGSDVLEMGNGYWLVFTTDGSVEISGIEISTLTISLSEGWNLIAGISSPVAVGSISDPGGIIVSGTIYGYGGSYYNAEAIEPGKGYWVNVFADGEITLSSTALATKTVEPVNHLSDVNTLELSSGTHSITLYFGKDVPEGEELSYSLPPTFPQMAFDARFTDNMKYIQNAGEISVINTNSRLALNYSVILDSGEHLEWVLTTNSGKEHILNGTGGITLPPETKGMSLEKRAIFPDVYALYQNYPNPFNPVTKITYQLPEESYVVITIYNLAGQKVTTLVGGRRSGGFHAVDWYGKKSNGESVVSGLYFFRIETENFSKTLKMLLLK